MFRSRFYPFLTISLLLLSSCKSTRNVVYFTKDISPDSNITLQNVVQHNEAIIQPDDIIAINVASISFAPDDRPSQVFLDGGLNFTNSTTNSGANNTTKNSYLVDSSGNIDYPRIGKMKMGGLTIRDAKDQLAARLKDYLKQPVVEVRIVNYRITMLGEVSVPGPILAQNHKMSIIDAVAAAGGIPITGRTDNILIIRDVNGRREFARVDLHSQNIFNSPYFYLHQNDIVYVEPSRIKKQDANEFLRIYLPIFSTLLSSAVTVVALVSLKNKN